MSDRPSPSRRVRHHTGDEELDQIRAAMAIRPQRGSLSTGRLCVHVELPPFGSTLPTVPWPYRPHTPKHDLGIAQDGVYVEFDLPEDVPVLDTSGGMLGPRHTGEIISDGPLSLERLHPEFVKVRRFFWELWRRRPE